MDYQPCLGILYSKHKWWNSFNEIYYENIRRIGGVSISDLSAQNILFKEGGGVKYHYKQGVSTQVLQVKEVPLII